MFLLKWWLHFSFFSMTLNDYIGKQIKKARRLAHMTQKDLGDRLGKSGATIAYLEQGKRRVSPDILEKIAHETNQPLGYFFENGENGVSGNLKQQLHDLKQHLHQLSDLLHQTEQRALDSELMMQMAFDQASDAMMILAVSGRILKVNEAYMELVEGRTEHYIGRLFWEMVPESNPHRDLFKKGFHDAIRTGETLPVFRHMMVSHSGKEVMVESTSRMMKKDGTPWAIFVSMRPVQEVQDIEDIMS